MVLLPAAVVGGGAALNAGYQELGLGCFTAPVLLGALIGYRSRRPWLEHLGKVCLMCLPCLVTIWLAHMLATPWAGWTAVGGLLVLVATVTPRVIFFVEKVEVPRSDAVGDVLHVAVAVGAIIWSWTHVPDMVRPPVPVKVSERDRALNAPVGVDSTEAHPAFGKRPVLISLPARPARQKAACASAGHLRRYRCAFKAPDTPWPEQAPGKPRRRLRPFRAGKDGVVLVPRLWQGPAVSAAARAQEGPFTVRCVLHVIGTLPGVRVRWTPDGPWLAPRPRKSWYAGFAKRCAVFRAEKEVPDG